MISRSSVEKIGQDRREIKFPSGRFDDSGTSSSSSSSNFYKSFSSSLLVFFLAAFPPLLFVCRYERERDGLAGWRPPLGADSSLINGFKVSLIESNFLVLPVILIRRETENGYHNFSPFSKSFL